MPKSSHPKLPSARKDFFYYLPLITAIVVNLFWGLLGYFLIPYSYAGLMFASFEMNDTSFKNTWPAVLPFLVWFTTIIGLIIVFFGLVLRKLDKLVVLSRLLFTASVVCGFLITVSGIYGGGKFFWGRDSLINPVFLLLVFLLSVAALAFSYFSA